MSDNIPVEEKVGLFHSIPKPTGDSQKEAVSRAIDVLHTLFKDYQSQIATILEDQCYEMIYLSEIGVGETEIALRVNLRHEEDMVKADADKTLH